MAKAIANVNPLTDTFGQWLTKTNEVAFAISNNAVTVDVTAGGATVAGNGTVVGLFGANTLCTDYLRGGANLQSSANLVFTSSIHGSNGTVLTANTFGVRTGIGGMNSTFGVANLNITTNTVVTGTITSNASSLGGFVDVAVYSNTDLGSSGSATPILVYSIDTNTYQSAELAIQTKKGVNTEISKATVASDGTTAYMTVFGTINSPSSANVGVLSANQSGTTARIWFTQANINSSIKILAHLFR